MRYRYQVNEINVPVPGREPVGDEDLERLYARFDDLYEQSFGQGAGYPEAGREMRRCGSRPWAGWPGRRCRRAVWRRAMRGRPGRGPRRGVLRGVWRLHPHRRLRFRAPVSRRAIPGPAIIETPVTTIVVNPNDRAEMDAFRNIVIHVG